MDRYYANLSEIDDAIATTNNIFETDLIENQDTYNELQETINNNYSTLDGPVYDELTKKLEELNGLVEERNKVCVELQENIITSLTEIKTYMDPYVDLNTDDLPELETYAKQLKDYIADIMAKMEETKTVCEYDKDGNVISSTTVYVYDRAALQEVLDAIQPVLEEVNMLIDKTRGLKEAVDRAQSFADENATILDEYAVNVEELATGIMAVNSAASGVIKVGENLVDGAVWVGASVSAWKDDKLGQGLSFLENLTGLNLKSDHFKDKAETTRTGAQEFIAKDYVGMLNDDFYNNTSFGRMLNEQSKYSYDSEYMQNIQDTSKNVTTSAIEVSLGIVTGNPGVSSAFGALTSIGDKAEEIYNTNQNATLNTGTNEVLWSGIKGAIEGGFAGQVGTGLNEIAAAGGGSITAGARNLINDSISNAQSGIRSNGFGSFAANTIENAAIDAFGKKAGDITLSTMADVINDQDYSTENIIKNAIEETVEQTATLGGTSIGKILEPLSDFKQATGG